MMDMKSSPVAAIEDLWRKGETDKSEVGTLETKKLQYADEEARLMVVEENLPERQDH